MSLTKDQAGKIAICKTIAEIRTVVANYDAIHNGRIDLRGTTVSLRLTGEDLSGVLLEGADLSGSRLTDCMASGVSFRACVLRDVRITNDSARWGTLRNADFSNATITNSYFGPRTLCLRDCLFVGAIIKDTKFMMGDLVGASFVDAVLTNVDLRSADLCRASFVRASLKSVCLENASLEDADFDQVQMSNMEDWGEPDFSGARIADDVRYRFAIVEQPVESLTRAIGAMTLEPDDRARALEFVDSVREFAHGVPEAMLIYDEYDDILSLELFVQIVKAAKCSR